MNPSSSTGLSPPVEQRYRSRRQQRSRSRERTPQRTPPHTPSQSGQQGQHVVPPRGELWPVRIQMKELWNHRAAQVADQLHCRVKKIHNIQKERKQSRKWRRRMIYLLPQGTSLWIQTRTVKNPGTSSTSQLFVQVLPLNQGPAASSQGPAASANSDDESSAYSDEYSARSQDSGKTVLCPDLYILTHDEHWTVTPETHKYAAAGSFWFVTTANGEQQEICNFDNYTTCAAITVPRGSYNGSSSTRVELPNGVGNQTRDMPERCMATCGKTAGARAQTRSCVRGYHKQFARAKQLEWKSWFDNEIFDLVDLRKFIPKNYLNGRWVPTIRTDKQGKGKG